MASKTALTEIADCVLAEALRVCKLKIRHHEIEVRERGDVGLEQLRVVGDVWYRC